MSAFHKITLGIQFALIGVLTLSVLAGVAGVVMPAFGCFPALGTCELTFQYFIRLFELEGLSKMLWLSFFSGFTATLISLCGAIVLVAVAQQRNWLDYIQHLLSPLLVIPHAAAAIALLFILSPSGWLVRLFYGSLDKLPPQWAFPFDSHGLSIIFALALKELPFIFLLILSTLAQPQLSRKIQGYLKTARTLGYSGVTAFLKVVVPVIYPHIRLPLLAVLAFASSNVEIPLILGPNNPPTLAVAILHWFNHVDLSLRYQASAAAVLQLLITLTAVFSWVMLEVLIRCIVKKWLVAGSRHTANRVVEASAFGVLGLYLMLSILLVFSITVWSFATYWSFPSLLPDGLTITHWQAALSGLGTPVKNSVVLAFSVSLVATLIAMLVLEAETVMPFYTGKRWVKANRTIMNVTLYMPLMVPGVAFLFGLVWFQQMWLTNVVWFHLFVSHFIYVFPYVFISLAIAFRRLDFRYVKVAYGLGKSPAAVFWRVKLPLMFSPVVVAFALGVAISFGQYLPTLLSTGGSIATVTTEAVAVASGSSRRLSAVYVIFQALLPLFGFLIAWWLPKLFFNPSTRYSITPTGVKAYESDIKRSEYS